MKISEMTNEQASETLIRITAPIGNICEDEEAMKLFEEYKSMSEAPFWTTIGKLIPKVVAYMFKKHKDDLYEFISAITFKTKEEVANMNFVETINVVRNSYDEVLATFFPSAGKQVKKEEQK